MTKGAVNELKVDDFSFGQRLAAFGCCLEASGVSFFDTCGKLAFNPNNNFDEIFAKYINVNNSK